MCEGTHPFIPVPNVAHVSLLYQAAGEKAQNNLYFYNNGGWIPDTLNDLAESVAQAWGDHVEAVTSDNVQLVNIRCTDLTTETGGYAELTPVPAPTGQVAGDLLPLQIAFKLRFTTGQRGRSARGGIYTYGFTENQCNGPRLQYATALLILQAWQAMIAQTALTNSVDHVIVSLCNEGVWRQVGLSQVVTGISFSSLKLATQRRRQPRD